MSVNAFLFCSRSAKILILLEFRKVTCISILLSTFWHILGSAKTLCLSGMCGIFLVFRRFRILLNTAFVGLHSHFLKHF